MKKYCFFFFALCLSQFSEAQLSWPQVTPQTRPWTRWWWEGSAVNPTDLSWNLERYRAAGLGGVEITPIYGVYGHEKEFVPFLSQRWMQLFSHTLSEAKRMNLGVDLANGTGWPFGGPWVTDADASKTVYYKTYPLNGGESLKEPIVYQQEAFVRTANNKPASADTILNPLYRNKDLQALALDQIVFAGKLPLQLLMAYSEDGKRMNLTSQVDASGQLKWTAPAGKWTLYALFVGLHGKMVERAAPGGEGYAIDHFSAAASSNYFKRFDEAFKGFDISYLRAFFNDSYEVDDARGQSNWTPALLSEFKKRRGYSLEDYLPALLGKSTPDANSRVLYDYRSVIDELLLEHFTKAWKSWGAGKGALVRNQSHGSPANTLDLYAAVDIPETEGTDILRFKFASSASNVTGKALAASESATWLNEHFLSSWGDVKKAIDLYFLGGVNHIVYHGTAYSPKSAPWPGWLFYAAVHFQPVNPQWKDFKSLNDYITRVQSFLQGSRPQNDVLVYYPIIDRYSQTGGTLLQHFDGMEKNFENTDFEHLSKEMLRSGIGFDFFSDRQLQSMSVQNGKILTGGNLYSTLLLPGNKLISGESMKKILQLVQAGAKVIIYKELPSDVPGMFELQKRQLEYRAMTGSLSFAQSGELRIATRGKGKLILGNSLDALLEGASVRAETITTSTPLSFLRKRNAKGSLYFLNNRTDTAFEGWVPVNYASPATGIFDPETGVSGMARTRKGADGKTEVFVQVAAHGSVVLQGYTTSPSSTRFVYRTASGPAVALDNSWNLKFVDGGPSLPASQSSIRLGSWTEGSADDLKNFSGTASYTTEFKKPAGAATSWKLDLGIVHETAEVFLNGKRMGALVGPSFQFYIPASELKETNRLEILVSNLMANRIAYMDRNALPWKIFYNTNMPARKRENAKNGIFTAADWKPLPSGLVGPVTLTPMRHD